MGIKKTKQKQSIPAVYINVGLSLLFFTLGVVGSYFYLQHAHTSEIVLSNKDVLQYYFDKKYNELNITASISQNGYIVDPLNYFVARDAGC